MNRYRKSSNEWCFDYQTFRQLDSRKVNALLASHSPSRPANARVRSNNPPLAPDEMLKALAKSLQEPIVTF